MHTRLGDFLRARDFKPTHLALESGYWPRYIQLVRYGLAAPSAGCKAGILGACQHLTRRRVRHGDLFDRDKGSTGSHLPEE